MKAHRKGTRVLYLHGDGCTRTHRGVRYQQLPVTDSTARQASCQQLSGCPCGCSAFGRPARRTAKVRLARCPRAARLRPLGWQLCCWARPGGSQDVRRSCPRAERRTRHPAEFFFFRWTGAQLSAPQIRGPLPHMFLAPDPASPARACPRRKKAGCWLPLPTCRWRRPRRWPTPSPRMHRSLRSCWCWACITRAPRSSLR